MDFLTLDFFSKLLTIVFIDLILAGDNAIVIGMAARNLPKENQKKVILLGTAGAVLIRIVATLLIVWLLEIPWLLVIGGALLIWIAYKLLVDDAEPHELAAGSSIWAAVRTIIIADAAMGLDNVIAVAGAAHGDFTLVVLGLLISIPIVVWGSTLFITIINRFPWVIYLGSGILAYTAAKMVTHEPKLKGFFEENALIYWGFIAIVVIGVLVGGKLVSSRKKATKNQGQLS
ncbi:membrane protein [Paenibacillus swuensis]|uniref:Membrane protein n=1 Tax=Paenibacillus swuensis TaxID=1178515 RepID=A0A172TJV2_9BACL|nr:TerC family protein [Paenibacillus swuensis]ANE47339.1 membrane protein [Paenibacillus swuensis]